MKKNTRITVKKIFAFLLVSCFFLMTTAQNSGIYFDQKTNWTAIQAKAKKENKFIFVNCYTTRCKSCDFMTDNVFSTEEVGDAVNPNFISVNMRMEMTEMEPGTIKTDCGDARSMMSKYKINDFPTFLFFTPDGKLVNKTVGPDGAAQFISYSKDAIETAKQYNSMVDQYYRGRRDTLLLESLTIAAFRLGDRGLGDSVLDDLLPQIKNPFTKNRLDLIGESVKNPNGPGFELFLHDAEKIDQLEKPDFAETIVTNAIIRQSPMILDLFNDHSPKQSWDKIYNDLNINYGPAYAHRIIVKIKVCYYKSQSDWDSYLQSLLIYLKEYGDYLHACDMNNYAWDIFKYGTKPEDLAFGLSYSLRSLTTAEKLNPEFIDTYANLLYKSGKIAYAIAEETEALKLAVASQKKPYKETLGRMKDGQPTWEEIKDGSYARK
jgi:thioredoxin-related protein